MVSIFVVSHAGQGAGTANLHEIPGLTILAFAVAVDGSIDMIVNPWKPCQTI